MKTSIINLARAGFCTCLVLALAAAPIKSFAQEKGGMTMIKNSSSSSGKRIETPADLESLKKGDMIVMSCPKCKDVMVTTVTGVQKGSHEDIQTAMQHLCPGCTTTSERVGSGKNATWKVTHTCKKCGSTDAFCCVVKKDAGATKGMEK
jgi:hypothetical protein